MIADYRFFFAFQVFDFMLSEKELDEIKSFDVGWRACIPKITVRVNLSNCSACVCGILGEIRGL